MRESRTYGSVRGALSNGRPYRDQRYPGLCGCEPACRWRSCGLHGLSRWARCALPTYSFRACGARRSGLGTGPRRRPASRQPVDLPEEPQRRQGGQRDQQRCDQANIRVRR